MTKYLTEADILSLHADQLRRFGGAPGIRDQGLLLSALYRPQTGYYEDLIQEAAALWESLSQNHPFVDGNKRTAFNAVDIFLLLNGIIITAPPDEAYTFIMSLHEAGRFTFSELDGWLRKNTGPFSGAFPV